LTLVTLNGFLSDKTELFRALSPYIDISDWVNIAVSDSSQYQEISQLGNGDYVVGLKQYILNCSSKERLVIGYSLGGRLLLKLLELDSWLFKKVVFISTHPGLQSEDEKLARFKNDLEWVDKIESLSLANFLLEWNSQPVLATSTDRSHLSLAHLDSNHIKKVLLEHSLALQADYRALIKNLIIPQLWVAGERDQKFLNLYQTLSGTKFSCEVVTKAGHRVHFDNPEELSALISRFFKKTD